MRILGISGSLRRESNNSKLLLAAAGLLPPGAELVAFERLKEIPPYDEDDEATDHEAVVALREAIEQADAVLIATPEYNHSLPGHLKNALDWMSRPLVRPARCGASRRRSSGAARECSARCGRRPRPARSSPR